MKKEIKNFILRKLNINNCFQGDDNYFFIYDKKNVFCHCCQQSLITFIPFEGKSNILCPSCGSLSRHRMFAIFKEKHQDFFNKNLHILHIAPEKAVARLFRNKTNVNYVTGDLSPENYFPGTLKIDITDLHFEDNTFDLVICNHVLEHVEDDLTAMKQFHRVLKSSGMALLQVPIDMERQQTYEDFSIVDPVEREKHFGQHDHVRIYGMDYLERLTNAGFDVETSTIFEHLSEDDLFKFQIQIDEPFMVAYKK